MSVDKRVPESCDGERPDFLFDLQSRFLIIECDENQHMHISQDCERLRMINIGQSLGGVPVVFIRYNPDKYRDGDGTFGIVSKRRRLSKLVEMAKHVKTEWEPNKPDQLVFVSYMYYAGDQSHEIKPLD